MIQRNRPPVTATIYLREVIDALGVTQREAADACSVDPAIVSRLVHGVMRPDRERAMQMAAALDALGRRRGVPLDVRRDYIVGWLVSQEYVPRTLRPAGRRILAHLAVMSSAQQEEAWRLLRRHLQPAEQVDDETWDDEEDDDDDGDD